MEWFDGALPANLAFDPIPSLMTSGEPRAGAGQSLSGK
jgi:hypothetical protein